ncbi:MAG: hypothetical protein E6K81_12605 [Candidatus Eisenbacteria bacterium]|uniref:Mechanosensitive ion channel n=1 Tax=Eiseniibacteriota bacterium TaxID=2212470 RepID=A0A538U3F4_UNCEI|nr:MAG: hypothetical protein E6K81_12605 [Candidatus Eisenbacteria bacterium]
MRILFVLQATAWTDLVDRIRELGSGAERGGLSLAAAALVLAAGWAVAALLSRVARALLRALRFNDGVRGLLGAQTASRHEPAGIAAWGIYWIVLVVAGLLALDMLGFDLSTSVATRLSEVVPRIITSGLLFAVGGLVALLFGGVTQRFLESAGAAAPRLRGQVVTLVVTGFAMLIALEQLGFAAQFVMIIAIVGVAAIGLALALAFGLGCRDLVRDFVVEYLRSLDEEGPQRPAR